jgi:hypothetical protein
MEVQNRLVFTELLDFNLEGDVLSKTSMHEWHIAFTDSHNSSLPSGHKHQSCEHVKKVEKLILYNCHISAHEILQVNIVAVM